MRESRFLPGTWMFRALLMALMVASPTAVMASGHYMIQPYGAPVIYGLASIEEAAKIGCARSVKPYHGNPSITCDGSTTRQFYPNSPPPEQPPTASGWLPISLAYYYPDGSVAAGAPIGYVVDPPETKNIESCADSDPKGSGQQPCSVGNPIGHATGIKWQSEPVDIGEGLLKFARTYASKSSKTSRVIGENWHSTFTQTISIGWHPEISYGLAVVRRPSGQEFSFQYVSSNPVWVPEGDVNYRLDVLPSNSGYKLTTPDDSVEIYSNDGQLQSITTKQGRVVTLTYSTSPPSGQLPKLLKVTDDSGRSLTFDYYASNATTGADSIHTITDSGGNIVTYGYDAIGNLVTVTYPDSNVRTYVYNEQTYTQSTDLPNAMTGIVDEKGDRFATFGYNSSGRGISTEHAGGVDKFQLNYWTPYDTTIVTDPLGVAHTYWFQNTQGTYRTYHVGPKCTLCGSGTIVDRSLDGNGNAFSETDANGNQTTRSFIFSRNLETSRVEASNDTTGNKRTIQTDWNANFRLPDERRVLDSTGALKAKTHWTYNTRGQVLTVTRTDPSVTPNTTRVTTYAYCEQADVTAGTCPLLGLLKSVDGPRTDVTDVTAYTYYQNDPPGCLPTSTNCSYRKGDLQQVTNAVGKTIQVSSYDGAGRPTAIIDQNAVTINLEYNARGWLTARKVRGTDNGVETDDLITRIEYWPTGSVKKVTQPDGGFTSYAYDAAHRLTGVSDNAGNSITYTLNAVGQRTNEDVKDPSATLRATLSRTYDTLAQLQTQTDALSHNTGFTYDANGNLDQTTDALTRVADNNYDALDRLSRTLQDMGGIAAETKFSYDALDNLVNVNDPKLLDTTYTYNGFSDLKQLVSPDTGTTTYTYDSAGNRSSQTDARSKVANYTYDALNRLTGISYPTASSLDTAYTWDTTQAACQTGETFTAGRLAKIVDGSGNTVYCYDRFGHVVRKVQTTNAVAFTLRYTWNAAGQLTSTIYPDGAVVDYVYDTQGRVSEIGAKTSTGTRQVLVTNVSYYPFGPAASWRYGSSTGRLLNRTLNQNYQPGVVQDTMTGGLSVGYEFDEVGNLKKLRDGNQSEPPQRIFGYDGLNRLTQTQDGSTSAVLQGYTYDKTGNRTSATVSGTTTTYTYPSTSHRLDQVGSSTRAYDFNGNTTSVPAGAITRNYVYGDHNRMTQYLEGTTVKMNYVYNGRGEQVQKYLGTANTYTMYDEAGHWVGDYGNSGATAPTQQAIWFGDLPVGLFTGAGASQKVFYVQPDALGTPRAVIDPTRGANGTTVWKWDLAGEAFGTTAPNQDPDGDATQFVFDLRFPGQRYDSASGLNYNYFRDYEAATGRYVESDPIGLMGGRSLYLYVGASPFVWMDPYGLSRISNDRNFNIFCIIFMVVCNLNSEPFNPPPPESPPAYTNPNGPSPPEATSLRRPPEKPQLPKKGPDICPPESPPAEPDPLQRLRRVPLLISPATEIFPLLWIHPPGAEDPDRYFQPETGA